MDATNTNKVEINTEAAVDAARAKELIARAMRIMAKKIDLDRESGSDEFSEADWELCNELAYCAANL